MLRDQNKDFANNKLFEDFVGRMAFISGVDMMTEDPPHPQLPISMSPESHTAVDTTRAQKSQSTTLKARVTARRMVRTFHTLKKLDRPVVILAGE